MRRSHPLFLAAVLCLAAAPVRARELSLVEALRLAEGASPRLRAASLETRAAHEAVGAAEAGYAPSVSLDAVDSWGFPGSSGALGLGGLVGSSYRSGAAAGLVARDVLFDFGRTYYGVRTAEQAEKLRRESAEIERYALDQDVLKTYYECARFRSDRDVWNDLHGETELVSKEVVRYVDTGQRSIVDRYLAQAQVEEARTNRNYFKSRMGSTAARLALLTGLPASEVSCADLPDSLKESVPLSTAAAVNPYVRRAEADVELSRGLLGAAKTDYLPKILGVASVGTMERARLVARKDWSGGLGVTVPLFDGLGTTRRVGRARAELDARTQALDDVRLQMDEANSRYDEIIDASRARLEHLEHEQKLAEEGFRVAKTRYFKFQGTLVDLRDALRNMGRIEMDMSDTQAQYLEAEGGKALLNGAWASAAPR